MFHCVDENREKLSKKTSTSCRYCCGPSILDVSLQLRASRVYFCQALHTNLPHKLSGSAEYLDLPARSGEKEDETARPVQIPEQFFT